MSKQRRIIIVAGPNGAGKTTFAREYLLNEAHCPEALKLGIDTGTPVYVMRNNKIVDLTKDQPTTNKSRPKRQSQL